MTDSRVALGMDRLPWLSDEPVRPQAAPKRTNLPNGLLGWVVAAILLVAGSSYWLGTRTADVSEDSSGAARRSATVALPEASQAAPDQNVQPVAVPEAQPVPEPEVRRVTERSAAPARPAWRPLPHSVPKSVADRVQRTVATEERDRVAIEQKAPAAAVPRPVNTQNVRLWSPWTSAGAAGRVVQIGAFGTRLQAKRGWVYMVRAYPGVKRLPAVVVETRNSHGRPFYRFQIGTTSQAHSEVLCQRMERIRFSCAVVGLPGAKKAIER
jgi:hypothetical protein